MVSIHHTLFLRVCSVCLAGNRIARAGPLSTIRLLLHPPSLRQSQNLRFLNLRLPDLYQTCGGLEAVLACLGFQGEHRVPDPQCLDLNLFLRQTGRGGNVSRTSRRVHCRQSMY